MFYKTFFRKIKKQPLLSFVKNNYNVVQLDEMYLMGRQQYGVEGLFKYQFMRTRVMRLLPGKTVLNQATNENPWISQWEMRMHLCLTNKN